MRYATRVQVLKILERSQWLTRDAIIDRIIGEVHGPFTLDATWLTLVFGGDENSDVVRRLMALVDVATILDELQTEHIVEGYGDRSLEAPLEAKYRLRQVTD